MTGATLTVTVPVDPGVPLSVRVEGPVTAERLSEVLGLAALVLAGSRVSVAQDGLVRAACVDVHRPGLCAPQNWEWQSDEAAMAAGEEVLRDVE